MIVETVGRISNLLLRIGLLNGLIEETVPRTNTGVSRSAQNLRQEAIGSSWRVRQSKSGCEVVVPGRGECARNAWITGNHESRWGGRENLGLLAHEERFYDISGVIPGRAGLPAQSIIQGESWPCTPTVLRIQAVIFASGVLNIGTSLNESTWSANEEVREIDAGFRARKGELSVLRRETIQVNLIVMNISRRIGRCEFQRSS